LSIARSLTNAKFGLVRPEFFNGLYVDGETVALPVSPVDGYTYSRDELVYMWRYAYTGKKDGAASGKDSIWYFGARVEQLTGLVSSQIKYRRSESIGDASMTNDGVLNVTTIGVRRKNTLTMPLQPTFVVHPDSDYALDKPHATTNLKDLVRNCKASVLNSEAIFMGEFVHGNVVPQPVSPVDGYTYPYANVKYVFSWRWTTAPTVFEDPKSTLSLFFMLGLNQLQNIKAAIDGTGHVALTVEHYDDGPQITTNGRISVVALCSRTVPAMPLANSFVDVNDSFFANGEPLRDDALIDVNANAKYAVLRPEVFQGSYANGATVPLPVSTVDGYTYSRDELMYLYDYEDSGFNCNSIRIISYKIGVDQATGFVTSNILRLREGGGANPTTDGKLRVWTVAMRGHVQDPLEDISLVDAATAGAEGAQLSNPGFDLWSTDSQHIADDWRLVAAVGATNTAARVDGIDENGSSQQVHCEAGAGKEMTLQSSKLAIYPGRRVRITFKIKGSVATSGLHIKLLICNKDRRSTVSVDITGSVGIFTAATKYDIWFIVPALGDTVVRTGFGDKTIVGTLNFNPAWCYIQPQVLAPGSAVTVDWDSFEWKPQVDPVVGDIAQTGSGTLAFFPAIPYTIYADHIDWDVTSLPINRTDGTSRTYSDGHFNNTGLTQLTDYWYYPYVDEVDGHVKFVTGGVGSLGISHTATSRALAVEWYLQGHLPLAGSPIKVTTLGTGSPGGGGGGGGDSGCPSERMLVWEQQRGFIFAEKVIIGDHLWSQKARRFLKVIAVRIDPWDEWALIEWTSGAITETTLTGVWTNAAGDQVRTFDLGLGQTMLSRTHGGTTPRNIRPSNRMGKRVSITLAEEPHTFVIGLDEPDVDYHNNLPPPT
jgi:hypothetical protein